MSTFQETDKQTPAGISELVAPPDSQQHFRMQLPNNYHLIYSVADIEEAASKVAAELTKYTAELKQTGSKNDPLVLIVREGGIYFGCAVTQKITAPVEVATIKTKTYQANQTKATDAKIELGAVSLEGRDVVFIDDIDDQGHNRELLLNIAQDAKARSCKFAVLINRRGDKPSMPDFIGLNYDGKEWFVGYGMDDRGQWRHLNQIYIIKDDQVAE